MNTAEIARKATKATRPTSWWPHEATWYTPTRVRNWKTSTHLQQHGNVTGCTGQHCGTAVLLYEAAVSPSFVKTERAHHCQEYVPVSVLPVTT